jgi:hypothetical protein
MPGAENLPGAAAFPKYKDALRLTCPGMYRSRWKLPAWFHPTYGKLCLSSHEKEWRWRRQDGFCLLQSVARGQEFILDVEHHPEAVAWVVGIIRQGLEVS